MSHVLSIAYPEAERLAAQAIRAGSLIVLPTDTVYGVGCALDAQAIDRLYAAKNRLPEKAVPVLLADMEAVEWVASVFPPAARRLAERFWPGPLTLALPKRDDLPANLSQLPTVGVRVPDHARTRAIIAAVGGVLAVTSANISDQKPACSIHEAIEYLSDSVALYLDGGPCPGGVPSTVVGFDGDQPVVLRAGPIEEEALRQILAR